MIEMTLDESTTEALGLIRDQARSHLAGNEMPFWTATSWDEEFGGFLTRLDVRGRRLEADEKYLMMQVRMLASLSVAHRFGLGDGEYLRLAGRAFDWISRRMWDHDAEGFHFSVARDGTPRSRRRNTDAHAYALIGVCAYHAASGHAEAHRLAQRIFELLERRAGDGALGYREEFDGRRRMPLNAEQMNLASDVEVKTIDMHTNVLEAFTYLVESTGGRLGSEALDRLLELIVSRGIDPRAGCTITAFTRDWQPIPDAGGAMTTSFGLNVELAWLLLRAERLLGRSGAALVPTARALVDHALEFGFDRRHGGLAAHGPYDEPAHRAVERGAASTIRPWWTQAELMNALIALIAATGERRYLDALLLEWHWIWNYQIDHEHGSWFQEVDPATRAPLTTDKGGEWKTAFHTSRALIAIVEGITALLGE